VSAAVGADPGRPGQREGGDPRAEPPDPGQRPVATTSAITPRGVTFVPVAGVPPGQVVLAWDAHQPPRHISDLLTAARAER
jgi:hypothetical protein